MKSTNKGESPYATAGLVAGCIFIAMGAMLLVYSTAEASVDTSFNPMTGGFTLYRAPLGALLIVIGVIVIRLTRQREE